MSLAASVQITDQDINTQTTTQQAALIGQVAGTSDGRQFAYAKAAGALTRGQITEPVAVTANYATRTIVTASAAGAKQVPVTLGTTATADAFIGFYLNVTDTSAAGAGQGSYYITGNTAATAGNSNVTQLSLKDGLRVALTTSSVVSIEPGPQSSVIQHTAVVAIATAGVPAVSITSGNCFWNQTGGMASVLSDGAIARNTEGIPSDATAGAVETRVDATLVRAVGYAPTLTVTAKYSSFILTLA